MKIDPDTCVACGSCIPVCPVGAIELGDANARISRDSCVECGVCERSGFCPVDAFEKEELSWPRGIRRAFSDPMSTFESTQVSGRGTMEMKTNDVTNRFEYGEIGLAFELGRPGTGTKISEIEKLTVPLASLADVEVKFEPENPVTNLIDEETGKFEDREILDEKVLTAILELKVKEEDAPRVLSLFKDKVADLDTVVSVDLITRETEADGPAEKIVNLIEENNFELRINGKTCIGLGKEA